MAHIGHKLGFCPVGSLGPVPGLGQLLLVFDPISNIHGYFHHPFQRSSGINNGISPDQKGIPLKKRTGCFLDFSRFYRQLYRAGLTFVPRALQQIKTSFAPGLAGGYAVK